MDSRGVYSDTAKPCDARAFLESLAQNCEELLGQTHLLLACESKEAHMLLCGDDRHFSQRPDYYAQAGSRKAQFCMPAGSMAVISIAPFSSSVAVAYWYTAQQYPAALCPAVSHTLCAPHIHTHTNARTHTHANLTHTHARAHKHKHAHSDSTHKHVSCT